MGRLLLKPCWSNVMQKESVCEDCSLAWLNSMNESVGLIISVLIAVVIVIIFIVCTITVCVMFCVRNQTFSRIRATRLHRDQPEQDEEGNGDIRARDLSQGPPPAYRNVNQYQNVDLEHTKVVKSTAMYRLPTNSEVETTSLPPDYTSQRLSISVAPQEIQAYASEGQLPPTYSTAQLELMARRTAAAMEQQGISHLTYS